MGYNKVDERVLIFVTRKTLLSSIEISTIFGQNKTETLFSLQARGAIRGKTGKTAVLPGFCQIERGGVPPRHVIGVLSGVTVRAALVASLCVHSHLLSTFVC